MRGLFFLESSRVSVIDRGPFLRSVVHRERRTFSAGWGLLNEVPKNSYYFDSGLAVDGHGNGRGSAGVRSDTVRCERALQR